MKPKHTLLHVCLTIAVLAGLTIPVAVGQHHPASRNGRGLLTVPFTEAWDSGTFTQNNWTATGNWSVRSDAGNPSPAAVFTWDPVVYNYDFALVSDTIDPTEIGCSSLWLDFDIRSIISVSSGTEHFAVEVLNDTIWEVLCNYSNSSGTGWLHKHIILETVKDKLFRLRFRVHGFNSTDVFHWELDNIQIRNLCAPPRGLDPDEWHYGCDQVYLTWSPPACTLLLNGHDLLEGFENVNFPPQYFTQTMTNPTSIYTTWYHSNGDHGTHSGSYCAAVNWDYYHQDEWLIAHDINITGDLVFWSLAFQGSPYFDNYYVKVSTDHGFTWQAVWNLSDLPPYPSPDGWNNWQTPYTVDLDDFIGQVVDLAWNAADRDGQGLWFIWAIDDCSIGGKKIGFNNQENGRDNNLLIGYDVYRFNEFYDPGFVKINQQPVQDTFFCEVEQLPFLTYYFVQSVYDSMNCAGNLNSDTVEVLYWTIKEYVDKSIRLSPNPVTSEFRITGQYALKSVTLSDISGRVILHQEGINNKEILISTGDLAPGVYFVDIVTIVGVSRKKVMVIR